MKCLLLNILLCVKLSSQARILGVFLIGGYSHTLVFNSIVNELARRGHKITLVTNEIFPVNEGNSNNIRQINFYHELHGTLSNISDLPLTYPPKEHNIADIKAGSRVANEILFNSQKMQDLLDQSVGLNKFDLVLAEYLMPVTFMLKELFQAPIIGLCNIFIPESIMHFLTGQLNHDKPAKTFGERMMTWSHHVIHYSIVTTMAIFLEEEVQKYASFMKKRFEEPMADVDLVFYVDIPGFLPARALPRFVIPIGPIHINESATMSKQIKEFMDWSSNGVIYISMGTIVKFDQLPQDRQEQFFETFRRMPYNFILKCSNCDKIENELLKTTSNVKIVKWVDQLSILSHPNTKVFVSHAGYQSTLEAVYHAVPMVTFPHVFDQLHNADQIVANEIGLKLDIVNFQTSDLGKAILMVIQDKKYKENMMERSIAMREQPMKGVDIISFWVDYLAKHKHVKFLHGESRYMPIMQYFNLDIILFHVLLTIITTCLIIRRYF